MSERVGYNTRPGASSSLSLRAASDELGVSYRQLHYWWASGYLTGERPQLRSGSLVVLSPAERDRAALVRDQYQAARAAMQRARDLSSA